MLLLIEHGRHMPRQAFGAILQHFSSNENKRLKLSADHHYLVENSTFVNQ
jgi:hypothetical protein